MPSIEKFRKLNQPRFIWIALILIVAFFLRIYQLNAGLWFDEILTLVKYVRLPFVEILNTYDSENQHMLYSLLAHLSWLVFGESAWALRLPAVLFGMGSLWAVYLFGREVTYEVEAILAAGLLAFSYHHAWFSQNARGYTGLLFWSLFSSWLLIRALDTNKLSVWLLYGISAALGVYTHITMLFMIGGQFLCSFILISKVRKHAAVGKILLGFFTAGFISLLLFGPVLNTLMTTITSEGQTAIPTWQNPFWTGMQFVRGLQVSLGNGVLIFGAFIVFGWGLISYARHDFRVIILFLAPTVIGAITVIALGHHLWPRFFFFAFGFAVLIVIRGIFAGVSWIGKGLQLSPAITFRLSLAACVSLIILSASSLVAVYGPKQDFLAAKSFIDTGLLPGDKVITVGLASFVYQDYLQTGWTAIQTVDELNSIRSSAKRTWLVYTLPTQLRGASPGLMSEIERSFRVVRTFPGTLGDGTITVFLAD